MKKASVITISILLLCLSSLFSAMAQTVGVQSGQWIKYNINVNVSGSSGQGTWKVTIQSVSGTTVSGILDMDIYGTKSSMPFSIDVATGTGTTTGAPATLIIPANLQQGQTIPGMGTSVQSIVDRSYAGASRKVVYATGSIPYVGMTGSFYWDQATGVLLEIYGSMSYMGVTYTYEIKAVETNIWSGGFLGLDWWLWAVIIVVIVVVVIAVVFLMLRRRKPPVAPPPSEVQPPPPPPAPATES